LDTLAEIADDERDILLDTFRVWMENNGSVRTAGDLLFCQPKKAGYRLHRIQERTGRSLSRP
jgi:sugar diacid utilization regulator